MGQTLYSSQKIHRKYQTPIRETCSILLDYFNISKFYYTKILNSGELFVFDSSLEYVERWDTLDTLMEYPFFCHPRYQQSGAQIIGGTDDLGDMQMTRTQNCMSEFGLNAWVRIAHKTAYSVEEFGFQSSCFTPKQSLFLFNQLPQLNLLTRYFRDNNKALFSSLAEMPINLPELIGKNFYKNKIQLSDPNFIAKQNFLKRLSINPNPELSEHEIETIKLMLDGYSASQIALKLYRSKRTIEHRIENIKAKLQCNSKQELIQKAQELERFLTF